MEGKGSVKYSIVIPTYNESGRISSTLVQILGFMRGYTESFEVIVSDDNSSDNTLEIVKNLASENSEIVVLENPHRGKGPTVWSGFMEAKGDLIYMADADLSAPISEIKKLSVWIEEQGYDVVIASREGVGAERINEPFHRHLMGRVFNFLVRIIALPGIKDTQCGFKLFTKKCVKDVFPRIESLKNAKELKSAYTGAWDVEVLLLSRQLGYKIKSVPVTWVHVKTEGVSPIRDSIKMALEILQIKWRFVRGKYKSAQLTSISPQE
jgi:glycosyltransferase involved in cell wall biosynthesis